MILITIDEMQGKRRDQIEEITGEKAFIQNINQDIPYQEMEIMITYGLEHDWEVLDKMPHLRWIQIFQTGIEHVPIEEIAERGIKLTNVRNIYGTPMSEYVMSLILYEVRDIARFIKNKQLKRYDRAMLTEEVGQKTIGIFGTGAVGKEVAKKARAFDMNVLGFNSTGKPVENFHNTYTWDQKEALIKQCDFIVMLLPLIEDTHHFLGEEEFLLMKKTAYIINVGRGPLINQQALLHALANAQIKGAALDVFDEEPLRKSSPLWEAENLIITPHLSGKTVHFFERSMQIFKENYAAFEKGKSLIFEIDFKRGY